MEQFGDFTDIMRVRFWLFEVASQLSMENIELLFREDPLIDVDLNAKNKEQGDEILSFFYGAGREKINLLDYYNGSKKPRFKGVNNKLAGVGDKIESIFHNTKTIFENGPAKLFDIVSADTPQDAFSLFIQASMSFLKRSKYVHEYEVPMMSKVVFNDELGLNEYTEEKTGGHIERTDWSDISSNILSNDPKLNYEKIRTFLPSAYDLPDFKNSSLMIELLLLHVADAFIQVKFCSAAGTICNKLIINSDILLEIEKRCHIDRTYWFANPVFEQERIKLLRKEPVYFEQRKYEAFDFEVD
ncbi:hypothetical protein [Pseudoalteromonas spongiae]|uniref:Uncharacterized protein n=1 Tax=Pseudoalteromonas spongiae TaxID=298657 RepID=A0ABU8ETN9_9GAMM